MAGKRLSILCGNINIIPPAGADPEITGIVYDSRKAFPGCLFAALPGIHTDGRKYILQAAERGAAAVLYTGPVMEAVGKATMIRTDTPREDLSRLSAELYDRPSEHLTITGVTGTDGKSTTVFLLYQLLNALGYKTGFLSTVAMDTGWGIIGNPFRQSTPEAPEIHRILFEMVSAGCTHAVVEATSHGLSDRTCRLSDVRFCSGVMTNVSHEHLEFHGTFEKYRDDKANLFRKVAQGACPNSFSVLNADDPSWKYFKEAAAIPSVTYGLKPDGGDLWADEFKEDVRGTGFTVHRGNETIPARISIPGLFNVENSLAALAAATQITGTALEEAVSHLPSLTAVKGRMKHIDAGQPFTVFVDYAHTPASFARLLPMMKRQTPGRLTVVFGSAGERDTEKRAIQGRIAGEHCDILILADEDPRGDEPLSILQDIASGCPGRRQGEDIFLIPDRREAIRFAFRAAGPDDTVLLLGKGHESSIIYSDGPIPWDEEQTARDALTELGYDSHNPRPTTHC